MQLISDSVGDKGVNNATDVSLVEAILVNTLQPQGNGRYGPYLQYHDGTSNAKTIAAIRRFQKDHVTLDVNGKRTAHPQMIPGLVRPDDVTWQMLIMKLPYRFYHLGAFPGTQVVYLRALKTALDNKYKEVANGGFTTAFAAKIRDCIDRFYAKYGIAIGMASAKTSGRRSFQTQYVLMTDGRKTTNAGPGESNHNFGMAVDLGFRHLNWLWSDGQVMRYDDAWLEQFKARHPNGKADEPKLWAAMRATGIEAGMFRGPVGDHPHLQNWDDAHVNAGRSLAAHLTASGAMKWSAAGKPLRYSCDLGYGGARVDVGSAVEIWGGPKRADGRASVSAVEITKLRQDQADRLAKAQVPPPDPATIKPLPAATAADVTAMREELHRQFELAETNWANWIAK